MTFKDHYLISELAQEFDITPRTIRYYEKRGLIAPSRSKGNYRLFTRKDRARLKLILRGKRFGYSLEEISEMIGYWNSEPLETDQIRKTLEFGDIKLMEINRKMEELASLKSDLLNVRDRLVKRLTELTHKEK